MLGIRNGRQPQLDNTPLSTTGTRLVRWVMGHTKQLLDDALWAPRHRPSSVYGAGVRMASTSSRPAPVLRTPCGTPSGATSSSPACIDSSRSSSRNTPSPSSTWYTLVHARVCVQHVRLAGLEGVQADQHARRLVEGALAHLVGPPHGVLGRPDDRWMLHVPSSSAGPSTAVGSGPDSLDSSVPPRWI